MLRIPSVLAFSGLHYCSHLFFCLDKFSVSVSVSFLDHSVRVHRGPGLACEKLPEPHIAITPSLCSFSAKPLQRIVICSACSSWTCIPCTSPRGSPSDIAKSNGYDVLFSSLIFQLLLICLIAPSFWKHLHLGFCDVVLVSLAIQSPPALIWTSSHQRDLFTWKPSVI